MIVLSLKLNSALSVRMVAPLARFATEYISNRVSSNSVPDSELIGGGAATVFADHRPLNIGGELVPPGCWLSRSRPSDVALRLGQQLREDGR